MAKVYIGDIVHTKSLNDFEIFIKGFVAVNTKGEIEGIGNNLSEWSVKNAKFMQEIQFVHLNEHQFLMPGFVDCHIHAPQVAQIGLGLDLPLLDWLKSYTFPLEAKFIDEEYSQQVYDHAVRTTINCGTTLASYFGTNHHRSTLILAKKAIQYGQRAFVGKVCSDCNTPENYIESTEVSVADTLTFIEDVHALNSDLVYPIITPRFAVSCSADLLHQLGDIAKKQNLNVQSHISENLGEIEFVRSVFGTSYAKVYENAGLLTNKTVLAHAVHLEDEEIALLSEHGTSIAHCPASNTLLGSGLCDILRLIKGDVQVGLGTDISAGNSFSIKDSMLQALQVSNHLSMIKKQFKTDGNEPIDNYEPLNYKQAMYLATLGGAKTLSMDNISGNFVAGKKFDALIIDTNVHPLNYLNQISPNRAKFDKKFKLLEKVQRFIYVGDDRNIVKVFVNGKEIKQITI